MGETLDTIGSGLALAAAVGGLLAAVAVGVKEMDDHLIGLDVGSMQFIQFLEERLPGPHLPHQSACEMGWALDNNTPKSLAEACGPKYASMGRLATSINVHTGRSLVVAPK